MSEILNFSDDPYTRSLLSSILSTAKRVNSQIAEIHGDNYTMDLTPKEGAFTINDKLSKFNGMQVRYNNLMPNAELFSLASELVRPADEPFSARKAFAVDSSFHEGSQTIGFDVVVEHGEAKLHAAGRPVGSKLARADATIDRELTAVGKISNYISITRDDIQQMNLRNDRGLGPLVSLLSEKLRIARKNLSRTEDSIIWTGGNIEGIQASAIPGVFDFFSTSSAVYDADRAAKARKDAALAVWSGLTSDAIIAQIATGAAWISRNSAYMANTLVLPMDLLINELGLKKTSETDSKPLINWIKEAFQNMFQRPLEVIGSNALMSGTVAGAVRPNDRISFRGFMLLDSNKDYQAIAEVESLTMLPSKEDKEGTIEQVATMKTGGFQMKHPGSMYLGEFASNS